MFRLSLTQRSEHKSRKMFICKIILSFVVVVAVSVDSFTLQQLKENEALVRDCVIKIGIGPLSVNRLRKGDLSQDDEKSQVSRFSELSLHE